MKHPIDALRGLLVVLGSVAVALLALAADVLPQTEPPLIGKIGFSAKDSIPEWPKPIKAPKSAPNIVLILLDDIGFADTSTFGGVAQTPELAKLLAQGLHYNNFNTTAMCSPTRASLLTGRNHHRAGFGIIADMSGGFPGYNSIWKKNTVSIAEVLRQNGYSTSAFGKWHNTPDWEITPTGPFDRWPTGLGFEYFYGFMGPAGEENQWEPSKLYRNTIAVDPPSTPQQGYHLTTDITNEAIRWVQTHESLAPEKPYFLYFATGAVHSPHHAPKEWIEKYRGKFDQGWDTLNKEIFARQKQFGVIPANAERTPRPKEIPAWDSLSTDQKRLYARQMEVYAGFIAHTDYEVGRLLKVVQSGPTGDNTLIIYIVGDNGSCGDALDGDTNGMTSVQDQLPYIDELGSPLVPENWYSAGWAWAGSTPFQWMKTIASHFGGVRDPMIVSWPERIKDHGGLRTQFTHVNDVAATLYDVTGIPFPSVVDGVTQQKLDGTSFAQTFDSPNTPSHHRTQYFEMLGNRAIYNDGWVAAARHRLPWDWAPKPERGYAEDRWELYHVAQDFSEAHDLAAQYPGKLKKLQKLFDVEARENDVYPLGGASSTGKPSLTAGKREFVYYASAQRIPVSAVPNFMKSSYRITADVTIPDNGAQGVIASYGNRFAGFALYVKDSHLIYENNVGTSHDVIRSQASLPWGKVALAFEFVREGENAKNDNWEGSCYGTARLYVNGQLEGESKLAHVLIWGETLGVGQAFGSPVSSAFPPPFKFSGTLEQVKVELK